MTIEVERSSGSVHVDESKNGLHPSGLRLRGSGVVFSGFGGELENLTCTTGRRIGLSFDISFLLMFFFLWEELVRYGKLLTMKRHICKASSL
jgi:hypothetical protein